MVGVQHLALELCRFFCFSHASAFVGVGVGIGIGIENTGQLFS